MLVTAANKKQPEVEVRMSTDGGTSLVLIRNVMAFDWQHAAGFKQAISDAIEYALKHAPQLMAQT